MKCERRRLAKSWRCQNWVITISTPDLTKKQNHQEHHQRKSQMSYRAQVFLLAKHTGQIEPKGDCIRDD